MKKIIYCKYSNERDKKFQIRTDILINENGEKFVNKTPLNIYASKHIEGIYNNYIALNEVYKNSKLRVQKCSKLDNGIELEYIEGKTLSEELDEILLKEDYPQLIDKIKEYFKFITECSTEKFQLTKEFIEVFGKVDLQPTLLCSKVNNIDLIFDNIIINDKWNMIDYEWTYNFLIPSNYVIYRAIKIYMSGSQKRKELTDMGIYKMLGITDKEVEAYGIMEQNFQMYVNGDWVLLHELYGQTTAANINVSEIIENELNYRRRGFIQVFHDYGSGFREEDSYKFYPAYNEDKNVEFEINLTDNTKCIRIDPCSEICIVNITSISGYNGLYYDIDYSTNGIQIFDNLIIFAHDDPQIVLNMIQERTSKVEVSLNVQIVCKHSIIQICKCLEAKKKIEESLRQQLVSEMDIADTLKQQIKNEQYIANVLRDQIKDKEDINNKLRQELKNEVDNSNALIQQRNNYLNMYNEISNAASWKMTRPVRVIIDKIKSTHTGYLLYKVLVCIKDGGIKYTIRKVKNYIKERKIDTSDNYLLDVTNKEITSFNEFVDYFNNELKNKYNCIYKTDILLKYDCIDRTNCDNEKVILMVSHELGLTGAPVALYYFAKSLKDNGYYPIFISPTDGKLAKNIADDDIPVIVYNGILKNDLVIKIESLFDYVVANTIVSYPIIKMLSNKDIPVIWWIHEAVASYNNDVLLELQETVPSNISIYSGGGYAKKVLQSYRKFYSISELLYYVPEINELTEISKESNFKKENSDKIIFAIIGMQEDRKGQDILADAIFKLSEEDRQKSLFVFIGKQCSSRVYEKVQQVVNKFSNNTKYIEELGQQELHKFYHDMDCLICASKDDPMPIVVTEAMMLSKLIICSENTGSAQLIREMQSGIVYNNNDSSELAEKISYVINNINNLDEQKVQARLTYEKYFSKDVFDYNVNNIIKKIGQKNVTINVPFISKSLSMVNVINIWKRDYKRENDYVFGEDILEKYDSNKSGRKVLLISHELSLTGAPIALNHFAKVLIENGDCPVVISPCDGGMKDEFIKDGIPVITYNELYSQDFLEKYNVAFDLIVMNTVVTYRAAYALINSEVPIIWWIHDSNASYEIGGFKDCLPANLPKFLKIYCGGEYAKDALLKYYPNYKSEVLLYDVPDLVEKIDNNLKVDIGAREGIFTFTTIGMQDDRKGHDVFVEAIDFLDEEIIKKCQFVFIGRKYSEAIWEKIEYICNKYPDNTKYIEEVTRDELIHVYEQSDCIVCCSKDDPMPIFVTEAMLMSTIVICSENTGSAKLIEKMNGGLIYKENSPELLMEKIQYVYEHNEDLDYIRKNARETYEKYFSEKVFKDNIIEIIENSIQVKYENYFDGTVSVVIPTFNAGNTFRSLIQLLKNQKNIAKIEINIVDSGSTDDTVKICQEERINLLQIPQEVFSHSFARNIGADNSTGDFIIFMTQDAMPTSTLWMSNLIRPLINEGIAAVSCTEICNEDIELYYKISSWAHSKYIGVDKEDRIFTYNKINDTEMIRKNASLNDVTCAVNHEIFNCFKYRFNYAEDLDLGIRLIKAGYKIKIMSSEKVIHGHNRSAGYYIKRTIVESSTLNKILNKKQQLNSVAQTCKRIIIGYKGINKIICDLRNQVQNKLSINEFFEQLDAQFKTLIKQDIYNLEIIKLAYYDNILDQLVATLVTYSSTKSFDSMNDIIYMCKHYSDEYIKKYVLENYYELNDEILEGMYDALYKQMAVFIGADISNMEGVSELQEVLDDLKKGV